MTVEWTAEEQYDMYGLGQQLGVFGLAWGGGVAFIGYGMMMGDYGYVLSGIVAALGGLLGMLWVIGAMQMKLRVISERAGGGV